MSEHSIIMFHACSKAGAKDSSLEDEDEEYASSLREHRQTLLLPPTKMVAAVALRGIFKRIGGGSSPEGGHVLEGPAVQPRW